MENPEMNFPVQGRPGKVSDQYVVIDTNQVIAEMADLGYRPREILRQNEYGLHRIDFVAPQRERRVEETPQVIFFNSYDTTRQAVFGAGLIRWVCNNGLIAGDVYAASKLRHIGTTAHSFIEQMKQAAELADTMVDRAQQAKKVELTDAQTDELIMRLVEPVYPNVEKTLYPRIAAPRRKEDDRNTAWCVFNRVQEGLMRGGAQLINENGTPFVSRGIKSLKRDISTNRTLWDSFDTFLEEIN
jgi:hypothetical protein